MQEEKWIDESFFVDLLEFTKANTIKREREVQKARSKGQDQKAVDKSRKRSDRQSQKEAEAANPWKSVIIVKTTQDNKIRLIPKSDFEAGRHELLYGEVSGQAPKPEVTPNVAKEISNQEDFEASKTSNRLLGAVRKTKKRKEEVVKSDHYEFPKNGKEKVDPRSSFPDWDHSPDSLIKGLTTISANTLGKQVNIPMIRRMFGASQTLVDSSVRAFQQLGALIKGRFGLFEPDQAYLVSPEISQFVGESDTPNSDLILQTDDGQVYKIAIIENNKKIITDPESSVLFQYGMQISVGGLLGQDKKLNNELKKLKEKITAFISGQTLNTSAMKYMKTKLENYKQNVISDLEDILINNEVFERFVVVEGIAGTLKFGAESLGSANSLMSMSRDGTNLRLCPLSEANVSRLLKETKLKLKLKDSASGDRCPFDNVMDLMKQSTQNADTNISSFFPMNEDANDAKVYLDSVFMTNPDSMLMSFITLFDLSCESIVISNIDLDLMGSIPSGDFTKINVNGINHYVEVDSDIDFYDGSALQMEGRDYKEEYNRYHKKKKQKKRRAGRNAARRKAEKEGKVHKGDGKDIDHKDHNPLNNCDSNTRVRSRSANRGDNKVPVKEEHGAGDEGTAALVLKYVLDTPGQDIPKYLVKGVNCDRDKKPKK